MNIVILYILDSALCLIERGTMWMEKRRRCQSSTSSRLHFIRGSLGYACIQIRQRGGRICRINSAGGGAAGSRLAPSNTLDFIKIHSARQAVTRATDVQTNEQANRLTVLLQKAPSPFSHSSGLYCDHTN